MSWKGTLREMSEPRDFDSVDFQAGSFAVGAEYKVVLVANGELIGSLIELSESRDFNHEDFQAGAFAVGARYEAEFKDKGRTGKLKPYD